MNILFNSKSIKEQIIFYSIFFIGCLLFTEMAAAITVEALREPIAGLKTEIFGGWMVAVKICAAAAGIVMSAFKGSLAPFAVGAGLAAGIHLYDAYLSVGADAALI